MADFLAELLAAVFDGLLPERAANILVGLLMLVSCAAFIALGIFVAYLVVTQRTEPIAAVAALMFFGLSGICGRLALKGFRP